MEEATRSGGGWRGRERRGGAWRREPGAAGRNGFLITGAPRRGGGWWWWLWAGGMGAGLSGTGDLARSWSRLGAGRVRVGWAPAREVGVGCGNKAAYLRLDATARRAGAGRRGRRQRGGSTTGMYGRDSRLREEVGVGEGTSPPSIPPPDACASHPLKLYPPHCGSGGRVGRGGGWTRLHAHARARAPTGC